MDRLGLWGSIVIAVISALLPEIESRWLNWPPDVAFVAWIGAPIVFSAAAGVAYYFSGKRRITLLLWLLAPFSFFNILQFLLVAVLWTLRGGGV
jgi:hypothetical protein